MFPFPTFCPPKSVVQIAQGTGSAIGNLTALGGLAALFDGVTNQAGGVAAVNASTTGGYGGKTYVSAYQIAKAIVYAPNDRGFHGATNTTFAPTLTLYGKNGVPANATDGTALGTLSILAANDVASAIWTVTSTSSATWTNVWVNVSFSSATDVYVAEMQFFQAQ